MELNLPTQVDQTRHSYTDLATSFGLVSGDDIHASPDQQVVDTGGEVVVSPVVIPPTIPYHPYWANIRKDGAAWEAEFTQAYIDDLARAFNHQVALVNSDHPAPGVSFETAGFVTITSTESWGVNIKTDTDGVVTGVPTFELFTAGTKSQEHREITIDDPLGQVGDYWIKVVYFEEVDDVMTYTYTLDHNVIWGYRAIHNTDTGDATVFKEYDDSLGFPGYYLLRTITGTGNAEPSASSGEEKKTLWLKAENDGDTIRLTGSVIVDATESTHPWKATADGTGDITVAPGKVMFPLNKGGTPADPLPIVYDYISYAGGAIGVAGAGWLYAVCEMTGDEAVTGQDNLNITTTGLNLNSIQFNVRSASDLSVVFSSDAPSAYTPVDNHFYFPIAEVANGGSATVEDQILTHNPIHDLITKMDFS